MYDTSLIYKQQANERLLRNPSHLRINFGLLDPQAVSDSTITDNGAENYSNTTNVDLENVYENSYATFEHGRWFLDGTQDILPTENFSYQGFVGNKVSNENCDWAVPPTITITFTQPFAFKGLTFNFDTETGDKPQQLQIKAYSSDVLIYNQTQSVTSVENWVWNNPIPNSGEYCDKLEIVFLKSNLPYRRARLTYLIFGIIYNYTNDDLVKANWNRSFDLATTILPKYDFNFTIFDKNLQYDPENPEGGYAYLEAQQPVTFDFGYELDDKSIYWITGGIYHTTGDVDFDNNGSLSQVTFHSTSIIGWLTDMYKEGVYSDSGISLYNLAVAVLTEAGVVDYELDDCLKTIITKAPLPITEYRNCLQLIANAGMCTLTVDRSGKIVIKQHSIATDVFSLDFTKVQQPPTIKKYPLLYSVDVEVTTYSKKITLSEITKVDIENANNSVYELEYQPAYGQTVSLTGTLTLVASEHFTRMSRLTLTGTGTVTINGYAIDVATTIVSKIYNQTGEICPINNELITNADYALTYADWIASVMSRQNEYSAQDRGYPELDLGDNITLQTLFGEAIPVTVLKHNISFSGSISGESKVLS